MKNIKLNCRYQITVPIFGKYKWFPETCMITIFLEHTRLNGKIMKTLIDLYKLDFFVTKTTYDVIRKYY